MHILITRPQESAIPLANHLQEQGRQVTIDPLLTFLPIPKASLTLPLLSSFDALVTTSQQAIHCLAHLTPERDFPLWCVGGKSASVAKSLGFQNLHTAKGSAQSLVEGLTKALPFQKPLLHISGDIIRLDIVKALRKEGVAAERLIVYETQEATHFSKKTLHALETGVLDAVLFYSPRTARIFRRLCQAAHLSHKCASLTAFCLSPAIRGEILDLPWKDMKIAKNPSTDDLLMSLIMAD